jgi:zinc protease
MIRAATLLAVASVTASAQTTAPKGTSAPRKPAMPAAVANYTELKYPELRPIASPAIDSITLPNGMRLLLWENHELPLIDGTVLVRTGGAFDPPEKIGMAALTAQAMLEGGTTNRPGDSLVRRFQDLGAELDGSVAETVWSISFSGLKENADALLEALKDGLRAPEFAQDRIDLVKTHARNTIAHRNDDGSAILRQEFAATVFGKNSPYGVRLEYANVDRINRGDMVGFHQRYFFPGNVMLSLEGDFDSAKMKSRIEALFGDWKNDQPAVPDFPPVSNTVAAGTFLAVKKDVARSYFSVGQLGGDYLDKDYPALEIMADILGGGPQGRLNQRLLGSVDTVAAAWAPGLGHPGLFRVSGTVANPFLTTQVLQTVFEELNKIRAEQVSEQELTTAKASALNSLVFAFENQFSILPRLTEYQYFSFPADYTQQYQKALEGVSRADVLRVAKERLDPAKMTTVVVGNPTAFEKPLDSLGGAVIPIDLAIPVSKPEAALGDAVTQGRGKQLLARMQQTMGGADKLAAVTDYVQEIAYQFDASAGGGRATMTERWMAPSHLRQDTVLSTGKLSVYCDGKTGWIAAGPAAHALTGVPLKQAQGDLFRVLFPLLLSDRTPTRTVNALDDETVEISDGGTQIVKVVLDAASGLPRQVLYEVPTENGTLPVIETYSDYREVSGLKLPYKVVITIAGKKFQDLTIGNVQINTGIRIQVLGKRP